MIGFLCGAQIFSKIARWPVDPAPLPFVPWSKAAQSRARQHRWLVYRNDEGENIMNQYLLSVHMVEGQPAPAPEVMQKMYADVDAFNQKVQKAGVWVFGGGLHP